MKKELFIEGYGKIEYETHMTTARMQQIAENASQQAESILVRHMIIITGILGGNTNMKEFNGEEVEIADYEKFIENGTIDTVMTVCGFNKYLNLIMEESNRLSSDIRAIRFNIEETLKKLEEDITKATNGDVMKDFNTAIGELKKLKDK